MIAEIEIGLPETILLASSKEEARDLVVEGIAPGRILLSEDAHAMHDAGFTADDARKLLDAKITMNAPRITITVNRGELTP